MSFDGVTMAQSPGDGSSRGLCALQVFYKFTTNNYTRNPFPRKIIKARALTSLGALSPAVAFVCSGRYVISGDGGFLGRQRGYDLCATSNSSNFSKTLSSVLTCSLAPA